MFKKGSIFVLLMMLVASYVQAAPSTAGKNSVEVLGSGLFYDDGTIDNAASVTARFTHGMTDNIALGVESGYYFDAEIAESGISFGDLNGVPFMGDVIVRTHDEGSPVSIYGLLGMGAIFWNVDESALLNSINATVEVDTAFAVKLAGGVDWYLNDNWAVSFEAGYVFCDADVTARAAGTSVSGDTNLDHWTVGGGLKFLF